MFRYLAILAVLPAMILGGEVKTQICAGGGNQALSIHIEGCDLEGCLLRQNQAVIVSGQVHTLEDAKELTVKLTAWLDGEVPVELILPAEAQDGCKAVNCPLIGGQRLDINFQVTIEVDDWPVGREVPIELEVANESGKLVFCTRTTFEVGTRANIADARNGCVFFPDSGYWYCNP